MYAFTVLVLLLLLFVLFLFHPGIFVTLILMYAFIVPVLFFFYCQVDFNVDNVQCCELVNCYGV